MNLPSQESANRAPPSWFGALELGGAAAKAEGKSSGQPPPSDEDLNFAGDGFGTGAEPGSFARLWRVFMTARLAIASVLLLLEAFMRVFSPAPTVWTLVLCIGYFFAAVAVRFLAKPSPPTHAFDLQWLVTIGVDVAVFFMLNQLQTGGVSYTPLFALPVLLSAVLGPVLLALGTAASISLLLLGDAWWNALQLASDNNARFLQAALNGAGFFLVALLANQLALRLAREESQARSSRQTARMQSRINQLVVKTLADGVLVADASGRVHSANPAAQQLLLLKGELKGDTASNPKNSNFVVSLAAHNHLQPLAALVRRCFATGQPEQADISLYQPQAGLAFQHLHVRTHLAASGDASQQSLCVVFLQDLRQLQARIRTEKMAAMGRMSAAVAHEIRNPLAAITQANALLEEDTHDPVQRQLLAIVQQNAQRLAKIVDDVLDIARVQKQLTPAVLAKEIAPRTGLDETVTLIVSDWQAQNHQAPTLCLALHTSPLEVQFESDHLRRLLFNLLDNALRYASGARCSIEVRSLTLKTGQGQLTVWSDGPVLEQSVEAHLFEPFFSSESRSSGLGLYICRELCERHGASIGYQRMVLGHRAGNAFMVVFAANLDNVDNNHLASSKPMVFL